MLNIADSVLINTGDSDTFQLCITLCVHDVSTDGAPFIVGIFLLKKNKCGTRKEHQNEGNDDDNRICTGLHEIFLS